MRAECPKDVQKQMRLWRMGLVGMPGGYVDFHRGLAEKELERLKGLGVRVHNSFMDGDGWLDGMRTLWVIAEYRGKLMKLHWHDGNQEFFKDLGCGSSPLGLGEFGELRPEAPAAPQKPPPLEPQMIKESGLHF
jgi:hypothetical protein